MASFRNSIRAKIQREVDGIAREVDAALSDRNSLNRSADRLDECARLCDALAADIRGWARALRSEAAARKLAKAAT